MMKIPKTIITIIVTIVLASSFIIILGAFLDIPIDSKYAVIASLIASVITCMGTIFLGMISLHQNSIQSEFANKMWKISNQDYFPVLLISKCNSSSRPTSEVSEFNGYTVTYINQGEHYILQSSYNMDCRLNLSDNQFVTDVILELKNDSKSKIKHSEIYRTVVFMNHHVESQARMYWVRKELPIKSQYIQPGRIWHVRISIYHDNPTICNTPFIVTLFIKNTTTTNFTYYEKIDQFVCNGLYYQSDVELNDSEIGLDEYKKITFSKPISEKP